MIIYLAVNRVNGKAYVGKTARAFHVRVREHVYDARNKRKTPFSRAVLKYGIDGFHFAVLEKCAPADLDSRERYWIDRFGSRAHRGYNITNGGEGTLGVSRPDVARRNSLRVGPLNHQFGKKRTEAEKQRDSELLTGPGNPRFGKHWMNEQRTLISERVKAAMKRPEVREAFLSKVKHKSAEHRQKLSASKVALWTIPEVRAKMVAAIRLARQDPEYRRKQSENAKRQWARQRGQAA